MCVNVCVRVCAVTGTRTSASDAVTLCVSRYDIGMCVCVWALVAHYACF